LTLHTAEFVRATLIENLKTKKVKLVDKDGNSTEIPIADLGIAYPVITSPMSKWVTKSMPDPNDEAKEIQVKQWDFHVQFVWKQTPISKRIELQKQRAEGKANPALARAPEGGQ
jgi:hypothetical protein